MSRRLYLLAACRYCKPSEVLCSQVVELAGRNGHEVVGTLAAADLVLVSTCGFDDIREGISLQLLQRAFAERVEGAQVVAMGCLNRIDRELLRGRFADLLLVDDLAALEALLPGDTGAADIPDAWCDDGIYRHIHYLEDGDEETFSLPSRAFLAGMDVGIAVNRRVGLRRLEALHLEQIREQLSYGSKLSVQIGSGCTGHCAYCVIKLAKGAPRSRPVQHVLDDIRQHHRGQRFVQLVADDCGSFGVDSGSSLFELVDAISGEFPALPLTLTYVNPLWLERQRHEYMRMFGRARINSVNISLQSGSDRMIQAMNRHYGAGPVLDFIDELERVSPSTMVYTHLLVGYPGETWSDFWKTARASDHFHSMAVFVYSRRKGSAAFDLDDDVPARVKKLRRRLLHTRYAARVAKRALVG